MDRTIVNVLLYSSLAWLIGVCGLLLSYRILCSRVWFWAWDAFLDVDNSVTADTIANSKHSIKRSINSPQFRRLGMWFELCRLTVISIGFIVFLLLYYKQEVAMIWKYSWFPTNVYKELIKHEPGTIVAFIWLIFIVQILHHIIWGPIKLQNTFNATFQSKARFFREVLIPYLAHYPYSVSLYFMIAVPLCCIVLTSIISLPHQLILTRVYELSKIPLFSFFFRA